MRMKRKSRVKSIAVMLVSLLMLLTACNDSSSTNTEVTPNLSIIDSPDTPTPNQESPSPAEDDYYHPDEFDATEEEYGEEGYQGEIEIGDAYYPMLLYDGLCYALYDDHASVVYTFFSDDTLSSYNILSEVTYLDKTYPVTTIEAEAFYCFYEAAEIILPDTITSIGDYAFDSCEGITSLKLPASLTTIGEYAFNACSSLTDIEIPDSVTSIGCGAFYDCLSLKEIKLPNGLTSVSDELFSGCDALEAVILPDSLQSIGIEAFWYCESLSNITLPDSIESVDERAFYDCLSLSEITLPKSLTYISDDAFDFCDSLTTVNVPEEQIDFYIELFAGYEFEVVAY